VTLFFYRILDLVTDLQLTPCSSLLSDNSSIILQLEAQATNSTLSEAQANSTSSEAQVDSTQSEALPSSTQPEAQEVNNPSLQQSSPDQNYYFVLEPEQVASVINYQAPPTYPYMPIYTNLTNQTPTATYTNLNQFLTPTVTCTAAPISYTQQSTTHETLAVAAEVTTTGEVDRSLEINRYNHIYPVNDPNLRTTCYSSVESDSDSEKLEPRKVA
jgi:hypothetical protein